VELLLGIFIVGRVFGFLLGLAVAGAILGVKKI
jgi:hypothetical protein